MFASLPFRSSRRAKPQRQLPGRRIGIAESPCHAKPRHRSRHAAGVAAAGMATALLVGCASTEPPVREELSQPLAMPLPEGAVLTPASEQPAPSIQTTGLLGSLRPSVEGMRTKEERVPEILRRGRIVVGVDQSQNLLSFRDPDEGKLEGFEVDMVRRIARDIFGDPNRVDFRYVDAGNWVRSLEGGDLDFVIRSISITRERQDQVFFSTPYFTGQTKLLTQKGSGITSAEDIGTRTVCATQNSTGAQRSAEVAPRAKLLIVRSSSDCLLALQQRQADAVISDDTILSGMLAQDPRTTMLDQSIAAEQYGIAFAKPGSKHRTEGLIRQVNASLEAMLADGTWQQLFTRWFGEYLSKQQPPALHYREEREWGRAGSTQDNTADESDTGNAPSSTEAAPTTRKASR